MNAKTAASRIWIAVDALDRSAAVLGAVTRLASGRAVELAGLFVEDAAEARGLIRANVEKLGLTGATKLWRRDATKLGELSGGLEPFDDALVHLTAVDHLEYLEGLSVGAAAGKARHGGNELGRVAQLLGDDVGAMRATMHQHDALPLLNERGDITAYGVQVDSFTAPHFDNNHGVPSCKIRSDGGRGSLIRRSPPSHTSGSYTVRRFPKRPSSGCRSR